MANKRNMYNCTRCPKCKKHYRWPTQSTHHTNPNMIICDDCGHKEPIDLETLKLIYGDE